MTCSSRPGWRRCPGSARGNSDSCPDTRNPVFADAGDRTAHIAEQGAPDWSDPRADEHLPDVYIAMGQTAENVALLRGVTREDMDHFGVRSQNLAEKAIADGFFAREISPVTLPGRHRGQRRRRAAAGRDLRGGQPAQAGVPARTAGSPRATAARSTTARPRWWSCPTRRAAALGITPLARVVATGVSALSPEIMGLGPVEAIAAGAGAGPG